MFSMYVLEPEINSKELLSQCTSKQVVPRDKQRRLHGTRDLWKGYLDPVRSNKLLGSKHKELWSSKTARQWKNPL